MEFRRLLSIGPRASRWNGALRRREVTQLQSALDNVAA
jgi:hypothetical protein